jgi:glycosyltransferase involved in cell wall biosynthesis
VNNNIIASVVIPLRNEEKYIEKCVQSILFQDYPKEKLEVIFVDGASSDRTCEIVKEYTDIFLYLKLMHNPDKTVPYAMNIGIKAAQGKYIIRLDAHSQYAPDYFSKCIEYLEKTGADNVGGPMIATGKSFVGKAIAHLHSCPFGLGGGKFHNESYEGEADTVYLGAFKKSTLLNVGLYDERLTRNQDIELNNRIRKAGGRIYLTPNVRSVYYCRDTIKSFLIQNYNNGKWNIYSKLVNKDALSLRHFVPLLFILSLIVFLGGTIFLKFFLWFFVLEIILYFLFDMFFSAKLSLANGFKYFLLYFFTFLLLHISYGLGSLNGLITIPHQRKSFEIKSI